MNHTIDLALNKMYQRQITSREQLLNEMLRVKLTAEKLGSQLNLAKDKEKLFQLMKHETEQQLGFFPADREDFIDIFTALKDIDPIAFALEIYKNDRMGTVISPKYLIQYIEEKIANLNLQRILITEAEKHLAGLQALVMRFPQMEITLTTQLKPMSLLLRLGFSKFKNVRIVFESIYTECLLQETFDYIFCFPAFGAKPDEIGKQFLTKESDGIATENMLGHLNDTGTMDIILPAKITFAGMEYEKLRSYIANHFTIKSIYILPEGTFRPATAIRTYLISIAVKPEKTIKIGNFQLKKDVLIVADNKEVDMREFLVHEDWRVELLLSEDDENIQRFKSSTHEKVKLKEVAEVFRGKSILKKDTTLGDIAVLNISNIENGEINYLNMDTIAEEERKIKRYELLDGDVVLSCRGTAIKSAVFKKQDKIVIASANVIAIRPKEKVLGKYIQIFLESPIGMAMIKSFQRGTTIMNINHSDIMEMEIPIIPMHEQQDIVQQYDQELSIYKKAVSEAEIRWESTKNVLYNKLI